MHDLDDAKYDVDTYDQYMGAHVKLLIGYQLKTGKGNGRTHELDGYVQGNTIDDPILDARTYKIEFSDG
jgi:hypothetical protein